MGRSKTYTYSAKRLENLRKRAQKASEIRHPYETGCWSKKVEDPTAVLALIKALRLKSGYVLRAYQYMEHSGLMNKVLITSVLLTQFLSLSCEDGCKRYNDYEQDKTIDVSVDILSDGFLYSWPDQLSNARVAYYPKGNDELLYMDVAVNQTDCEDAFIAINFRARGDDSQAEVVSIYLNNSDCDGHVGEMSEMEIRLIDCPIAFEWTEAPVVIDNIYGTMAVTFTACNIEIDNSGISGEPIVNSVTLDGLYTSEMTRTYCH